jgi:hypothetical protein
MRSPDRSVRKARRHSSGAEPNASRRSSARRSTRSRKASRSKGDGAERSASARSSRSARNSASFRLTAPRSPAFFGFGGRGFTPALIHHALPRGATAGHLYLACDRAGPRAKRAPYTPAERPGRRGVWCLARATGDTMSAHDFGALVVEGSGGAAIRPRRNPHISARFHGRRASRFAPSRARVGLAEARRPATIAPAPHSSTSGGTRDAGRGSRRPTRTTSGFPIVEQRNSQQPNWGN